jgi:hypothetical protein
MTNKKLRSVCPHCNRAIWIDVDEELKDGSWLMCTPLPIEESDAETKTRNER